MNKTIDTRYGVMEYLDGDSVVSQSLALYGEWAQAELDLLQNIIRPGDVVLDVGAFLGTHTLAFAKMVGPSGAVHSFEPRANIRKILASNVQRNELAQVKIEGCALGDSAGVLNIQAIDTNDAKNFGGLAIEEAIESDGAQTELILLKTLDSFGFARLDLLKIDAEGMEAKVLGGATDALDRLQPVVFAECNDLQNGCRTLHALHELDYHVYGFISKAFDSNNFRGEANNIFGSAAEVSLLGVPKARLVNILGAVDLSTLPPIKSVDDLALLLLHKPQYPDETWGAGTAGAVLGLNFDTPKSRHLQVMLDEMQVEIDYLRLSLQLKANEVENARAQIEASLKADEERKVHIAELVNYRRTSLHYRWQQLVGRFR
jgi:FkbM family methyltransferase